MTVDDLIGHYRRGNLDSVLFSTDTMLFPTLNLKSNTGAQEGLYRLNRLLILFYFAQTLDLSLITN
jgi:hypothetical protein